MSDLPADTLTTTIAEVIDDHRRGESQRDCIEGIGWVWACWCDCGVHMPDRDHNAHVAAAVVSVLATHNEHTAADAWDEGYEASDHEAYHFSTHGRTDNPYRLAAVSPTPPTHNATESPWNTHDTLTDAQQQEWWRNKQADESDEPTVCVAHGSFIPCRKHGEHNYTSNPYWVKSVRDYQTSTIPNLTWEPVPPTHTTTTEDR